LNVKPSPLDDAFAPQGEAWQPVSPRLAAARRLVFLLVVVPVAAVIVLGSWWVGVPAAPILALGLGALVGIGWGCWLIGRRVRSFGYAQREDDLLVTSGIMFRRLVVVPYGRMQLVDLTAGPIDRMLGVVSVQLHTAAASTDAHVPGLPPTEAAALRDRLAALGEDRSAGL
jgi:membrane protein YdbS with pleckstrin-like domain